MLHYTIKIKVIVTCRQSREIDVEMNDIQWWRERRMREKLAWSTKSPTVTKRSQTVTNGRKRSQVIASRRKWSQTITNNRKCLELVASGRECSQMLQMVTSGRKCSKCSKFPNVLSFPNVSNVPYGLNAPNVLNVSNVPNVPDVPNVWNGSSGPYVAKNGKSRCLNFTFTWKVTVVYSWEVLFLTISEKWGYFCKTLC